ncbi:hypothetical protein [Nioella sediminis]|jgi:hypothetical protein|uniref:hypothetical protein n=1 Tax=Nioella sediminis TaxID=1912092 RepID=UPI0008FD431C|nr:hypothetical protein [Nioella sediminis]TBX27856.1 hypothetical protein TK43_08790 [Roseovarius sp. JS7-11]
MMIRRGLAAALPFLIPLPAMAQHVAIERVCNMAVICIESNPCQDWGQEIHITEQEDGSWRVLWEEDLPSDYELAADILAPEGSLEPTRLRSLIFANHETQAVQMVSIADSGHVVVTLHQPQARPRSVTGFGLCEDVDRAEAAE